MKRSRILLLWFCFFALLVVSGFLYNQTQAINVDVQNQIMPALRELKQFDAEWNTNVLKSRIGMHNNYDPVTTPLHYVRGLRERLIQGVHMTSGGTLESALYKMEKAFVEKEELVEQFKSQNAVLQNSLRYFPTAVEEFKVLQAKTRTAGASRAAALDALDARVDHLLTDILRFNLSPEQELGERIAAAVRDLEDSQTSFPEALQEPLGLLIRHAGIVLRQRVVEDAVIARIAITPTAQAIDELSNALDEAFQDMLQEKQLYRFYLFAYSGFLLLLLTYAAWRVVHSYKVIAQVNKRLRAANETLEQRVADRTAELERQSAQLAELATHDTLTGLINRRHLMTRLEQALQRADRRGRVVALMFIDLDGFKEINDRHGHAAGDRVLQEVAARVQRHLRKEDTFARLGGDEFVILLDEVSVPHGAVRVADAVLEELRGITEIDGHAVRISASIGISAVRGMPGISYSPETLLNEADHAMYAAKQEGKNRYRFSDSHAWEPESAQTG